MDRNKLEDYISKEYGVCGEYMWARYPSFAVFRHKDNRKWFAVIMRIHISKLGVDEDRVIDVVNLKCPEDIMNAAYFEEGVFPAYHMSKKHWISVALDGSVLDSTVKMLLQASYNATASKNRSQ